MSSDNCIPVKVALQLMDQSSLGLADQHTQFTNTHHQLQETLKSIVNEHHQGFNSSIGTFHQIQSSIHVSQTRVRALKQSLVNAKGNLGTTRPELKAFATSSQSYDHMLQTLAYIEQLQLMPEILEAQISEKRFLGAVDTLQEALKLMRKPEMEEIAALADLRLYFTNQEHSISDILIEELHSHLYLKSPYCEERWKQYASSRSASAATASSSSSSSSSSSAKNPTPPSAIQGRQLYRFLDLLETSESMLEDTTRNPEADTFSYIQLLVESLDRMSRLDLAVDAIENRLPVELFRVVERSYVDVEQRYPSVIRNATKKNSSKLDVPTDVDQDKKSILEDMLSTLYAKFEAIAESHRVLHEVIARILQRQGAHNSSLLRSFHELWKLYQSEIRSLLHDHLATDGNSNDRSRHENGPSSNIFRPYNRDRNKVFPIPTLYPTFSDTDCALSFFSSVFSNLQTSTQSQPTSQPSAKTSTLSSSHQSPASSPTAVLTPSRKPPRKPKKPTAPPPVTNSLLSPASSTWASFYLPRYHSSPASKMLSHPIQTSCLAPSPAFSTTFCRMSSIPSWKTL